MSIFTDIANGALTGLGNVADKIIKDFKADPNKVLDNEAKLADLQNQIEQTKLTLSADLEKAYLKDIEDARNREIQIATSDKAPLLNKIISPLLAAGVTLGFFGILLFMLLREVPLQNEQVLNIMLGSLGTAWIGIVFYYFGSSSGSAAKDNVISKIATK